MSFCLSLPLVSLSAFSVFSHLTGVLSVPVWNQHPLQCWAGTELLCCQPHFALELPNSRAVSRAVALAMGTADDLGYGIGFGAWCWLADLWKMGL